MNNDRIPVDDEQQEVRPFNSTPTMDMEDILNLLKPGDITAVRVLKGASVGMSVALSPGMEYITVLDATTLGSNMSQG